MWVVVGRRGRCRGLWVVGDVGRGRGRGSWFVGLVGAVVVGRKSWESWVVVMVVGRVRGSWGVVGVSSGSVAVSRSVSRGLRFTRRRGSQLLPSLCTRDCRVGGARLRLTLFHSIAARAAAARLRLGGVAGLVLALHARVGGTQLRRMLSHSVAARTAVAGLRLGSVAPGLLRSLCIRGWAVRGADLRSLAQRRGSYCTAAASRGGVKPGPLPSRFTRGGWRAALI